MTSAAETPDPSAAGRAERLSAELEQALARALLDAYACESWLHFDGELRLPVIRLSDSSSRLGAWRRATRTLELSRALVLDRPWPEVIGVLQHEMAHQYVDEVLGIRDESAHGRSFREVCARRGFDARAAGHAVPATGLAAETDRVLDRVRKLLALAGSVNQHEAEVAMRRAHELMLRHNLAEAQARTARGFEIRHVGDPRRRGNRVEDAVISVLVEYFFVKVIRLPVYLPRDGARGAVFELTGTRANVEMAVHVYDFLLGTAARLWQENRADPRVRSGRDRVSYQFGVILGFRDKLRSERTELKGTGLVWVGDRELDRFYRARNPRLTTRRARRVRIDGAHNAGREAGREIVLHRPVEDGPSGGRPKLLGRSK